MLKQQTKKYSFKWHKTLGWIGGLALLVFAISGILHPVMSWTGPKPAAFFPPQMQVSANDIKAIPNILQRYQINQAVAIKLMPTDKKTVAHGSVLQVTENAKQVRRYFDLQSGRELKDYDQQQAVWLARYYSGLKNTPIQDTRLQTEFDNSYPWVNRLLPVYRVSFASEDQRTAFIYTELGSMSGLTNDLRTTLQGFFRTLHTWNWLDNYENPRVFLMLIFLLVLLALAITGLNMLLLLKNRKNNTQKVWHRYLAYIVCMPLLFFTASGIFHLLQNSNAAPNKSLELGDAFSLSSERFSNNNTWIEKYTNTPLNAVSIIEGPEQQLFYRVSMPSGKSGKAISKQQRFKGKTKESKAIYINAQNGELSNSLNDQTVAEYFAKQHIDHNTQSLGEANLVKRFGPLYDFRNKRLPVWQFDVNGNKAQKIFIDPATGMLVDSVDNSARVERYSFTFLHKWNFLTPFTGRKNRDVIIVIILSLSILLTLLGYYLLFTKGRVKNKNK